MGKPPPNDNQILIYFRRGLVRKRFTSNEGLVLIYVFIYVFIALRIYLFNGHAPSAADPGGTYVC